VRRGKGAALAASAVLVLLLLFAYAYWVFCVHEYRFRASPGTLLLSVGVRVDRTGKQLLDIVFSNKGNKTIVIVDNRSYDGPMTAALVFCPSGGGAEVLVIPKSRKAAPGTTTRVLQGGERWLRTVRIEDLYPTLSPGNYLLTMVYDTSGKDAWPREADLARAEAQVRFTVSASGNLPTQAQPPQTTAEEHK
jgi:hypothetical protein